MHVGWSQRCVLLIVMCCDMLSCLTLPLLVLGRSCDFGMLCSGQHGPLSASCRLRTNLRNLWEAHEAARVLTIDRIARAGCLGVAGYCCDGVSDWRDVVQVKSTEPNRRARVREWSVVRHGALQERLHEGAGRF